MRGAPRKRARTRAAERGPLSRVFVLLTLLAFALQGFVVQTHIHVQAPGARAAIDLFDGKPSKNVPAKGDEGNCPLCQAFASAGSFVTPAVAALAAPNVTVSVIELAPLGAIVLRSVAHSWHGRAPPLG